MIKTCERLGVVVLEYREEEVSKVFQELESNSFSILFDGTNDNYSRNDNYHLPRYS